MPPEITQQDIALAVMQTELRLAEISGEIKGLSDMKSDIVSIASKLDSDYLRKDMFDSRMINLDSQRELDRAEIATLKETVKGWKTKAWGLLSVVLSALIVAFLSIVLK